MADLGSDFSCVTDITPDLRVVSGEDCFAESLQRELAAAPGDLWYAPDWGAGLVNFINSTALSWALSAVAERTCMRDERTENVSARTTTDGESATITIDVESGEGPFVLIANITDISVEVLRGNS